MVKLLNYERPMHPKNKTKREKKIRSSIMIKRTKKKQEREEENGKEELAKMEEK